MQKTPNTDLMSFKTERTAFIMVGLITVNVINTPMTQP